MESPWIPIKPLGIDPRTSQISPGRWEVRTAAVHHRVQRKILQRHCIRSGIFQGVPMIFPWTSSCHAINAWPRRSGNGNSIFRSKRPGRSSAGSSVSWRFLGAVSKVPGNLSNMYIYICIYIYMRVCVETNGLFMEIIWNLYTKK